MPNSGYFDVVFASSGDKTAVPDTIQGSGSVSYPAGFGVLYSTAVGSGGLNISRAQTNQLFFDITTALQYLQQHGAPPFITSSMNGGTPFSYGKGALASFDAGSGAQNWVSVVSSNTATPGSSPNWVPLLPTVRTPLLGNMTYYISPSGSDSTGTGTSGAPWQTRQHAWNFLQANIDMNGHNVTIKLLDTGSATIYTDVFSPSGVVLGQLSPSQITFDGNDTSPTNVVINSSGGSCWPMSYGLGYVVSNMVLESSVGDCLTATTDGNLQVGPGITFGTCVNNHMTASVGGRIRVLNSYAITGPASGHFSAQDAGSFIGFAPGITVTITGTPAFATYAAASVLAEVYVSPGPAMAFSGPATGTKYSVDANAVIQSGGVTFPGSTTTAPTRGGQYV